MADLIFDFYDKPSTFLVKQGVMSMTYMGNTTCTATAFNYAYNNMFTTAKGIVDICFFVFNGITRYGNSLNMLIELHIHYLAIYVRRVGVFFLN